MHGDMHVPMASFNSGTPGGPGCNTGIWGSGNTLNPVVIKREKALIYSIICCPLTLHGALANTSSCVEFVIPSNNKFANKYNIPITGLFPASSPLPFFECFFSGLANMNIDMPAVTRRTTMYLCKANLRR